MTIGIGIHTEKLYRECCKRVARMELLDPSINYHERVDLEFEAERQAFIRLKPKITAMMEAYREVGLLGKQPIGLEGKWVFVTLRPEEGATDLRNFINDCYVFVNKGMFLQKEYVFEQTGKTEESAGTGFHCHILANVKSYVNVKDIITAWSFVKYNVIIQIGSKTGKKFLKDETDLEFCKHYIRGEKHNKDKEPAVAIDKIWRKTMGLKDIYESP